MTPLPVGAVPPPPAFPGQHEAAEQLVLALTSKNTETYASLLADDVQVFVDGKVVARTKAEWMARFGEKLAAPGVFFKVIQGYSSTGRVLLIEYFSSTASWGTKIPTDCCWSYDAVAYDYDHKSNKVVAIHRLTGGSEKLDEHGKPAGY
ncbi:MAG: hypothetical protein J7493_01420 [Porphyrobacter sp.]|nr:hypothetical protein [Porphyrobacter sp.]